MSELELTKMLFVYETTVGGFESDDVLDLFTYYSEATDEIGFDKWLENTEVEKEWEEYKSIRGIDHHYK